MPAAVTADLIKKSSRWTYVLRRIRILALCNQLFSKAIPTDVVTPGIFIAHALFSRETITLYFR